MVIMTILIMDLQINMKIKIKNSYRYVLLLIDDGDLNFMQFHYRLIVHQRPLNYNCCKVHNILKIYDELVIIMKLYEILITINL
jgi:hypothetical protein